MKQHNYVLQFHTEPVESTVATHVPRLRVVHQNQVQEPNPEMKRCLFRFQFLLQLM